MGINMGFFVSGDWIKKFFEQKELQIRDFSFSSSFSCRII